MLSSRLHCVREMKTSNLKHKDCCFHHLQTLFVEGIFVQQLDSFFLSFDKLLEEVQNWRMEGFGFQCWTTRQRQETTGKFQLSMILEKKLEEPTLDNQFCAFFGGNEHNVGELSHMTYDCKISQEKSTLEMNLDVYL